MRYYTVAGFQISFLVAQADFIFLFKHKSGKICQLQDKKHLQ